MGLCGGTGRGHVGDDDGRVPDGTSDAPRYTEPQGSRYIVLQLHNTNVSEILTVACTIEINQGLNQLGFNLILQLFKQKCSQKIIDNLIIH